MYEPEDSASSSCCHSQVKLVGEGLAARCLMQFKVIAKSLESNSTTIGLSVPVLISISI